MFQSVHCLFSDPLQSEHIEDILRQLILRPDLLIATDFYLLFIVVLFGFIQYSNLTTR